VEIHDTVFDSNSADYVSSTDPVLRKFPEFSAPIPGGPHATYRVVLFMLAMVLVRRSTPHSSLATLPAM
jgi:hypothetical protein